MTDTELRSARLAYIAAERQRYIDLEAARRAYHAAAHALGLHALNQFEIADRLRQLDAMEAEVAE